ncbi:MAG: hypothetical protein PHD00_09010 [Bacteroidales bacterium]|nr:hypothetical protein [Bacteroidales bacterium]MDD4671938.1 hypothetical protein [Bacteroidales bacterium]
MQYGERSLVPKVEVEVEIEVEVEVVAGYGFAYPIVVCEAPRANSSPSLWNDPWGQSSHLSTFVKGSLRDCKSWNLQLL